MRVFRAYCRPIKLIRPMDDFGISDIPQTPLRRVKHMTAEEWRDEAVKPRKVRKKGANWRVLADGSPSSDGIHADIIGACRIMFGPPGICNKDGVLYWSVEQRRSMSKGGNFMAQARGCIGGTPEFFLIDNGRIWPGEFKRPESIAPLTGRKVAEEELTPAQKKVHPEFAKAHCDIQIWRSREEFIEWVDSRRIKHRKITL